MRFGDKALAALALLSSLGRGQTFVASPFAGGAPPPSPIGATKLAIAPVGMATDAAGNSYFASHNVVYELGPNGIATRIAGDSQAAYSGDGGLAIDAEFVYISAVAADRQGNLFIADFGRIRRISADHTITTVAGTGTPGSSGDGPAAAAQIMPSALTADTAGNLFFISGTRVRKLSTAGIVTTVAGDGSSGRSGDGGPAASAQLGFPDSLAVDSHGNLYIGDEANLNIRKVSQDGIITTVAGAPLTGAAGLAFDSAGNLYVSDSNPLSDGIDCSCIRKISPTGSITTLAAPGVFEPRALAVGAGDNLFVAASNGYILKLSPDGVTSVAAGTGSATFFGDGGPAISALLDSPTGVAVDGRTGIVYISDTFNHRIRAVSPDGTITTIAGNGVPRYSGDGGPAVDAELYYPIGLAVDSHGNIYIGDHGNLRIRKISTAGIISTVVDQTVLQGSPVWSLAVDKQDSLYVPDAVHSRIFKITPDGVVHTIAGTGVFGYSGDGGPAIHAQIRISPKAALATGADGSLYFSDDDVSPPAPGVVPARTLSSPRIRRVSADGTITTVAGNGISGYSGDGGPATRAQLGSQLNFPVALATDSDGNLYVADGDNGRVRRVSRNGRIATIAEIGSSGVAVDPAGNVYVTAGNVVRMLKGVSTFRRMR
jgi:sugar lactone lactonase YvrE